MCKWACDWLPKDIHTPNIPCIHDSHRHNDPIGQSMHGNCASGSDVSGQLQPSVSPFIL